VGAEGALWQDALQLVVGVGQLLVEVLLELMRGRQLL